MNRAGKYTDAQIRAGLSFRTNQFREFMEMVENDTDDALFFRHVNALLHQIYAHYIDGKYLTKMQACRMIPLRNITACQKYVADAEKKGFIRFEADKNDKRKVRIIPDRRLIQYIEAEIEKSNDEIREAFYNLAIADRFPTDNAAFAGADLRDTLRSKT